MNTQHPSLMSDAQFTEFITLHRRCASAAITAIEESSIAALVDAPDARGSRLRAVLASGPTDVGMERLRADVEGEEPEPFEFGWE